MLRMLQRRLAIDNVHRLNTLCHCMIHFCCCCSLSLSPFSSRFVFCSCVGLALFQLGSTTFPLFMPFVGQKHKSPEIQAIRKICDPRGYRLRRCANAVRNYFTFTFCGALCCLYSSARLVSCRPLSRFIEPGNVRCLPLGRCPVAVHKCAVRRNVRDPKYNFSSADVIRRWLFHSHTHHFSPHCQTINQLATTATTTRTYSLRLAIIPIAKSMETIFLVLCPPKRL